MIYLYSTCSPDCPIRTPSIGRNYANVQEKPIDQSCGEALLGQPQA